MVRDSVKVNLTELRCVIFYLFSVGHGVFVNIIRFYARGRWFFGLNFKSVGYDLNYTSDLIREINVMRFFVQKKWGIAF